MDYNCDLYKAFQEKCLNKFNEALEVYEADPNAAPHCDTRSIFEIILSTPNSACYIEKCIKHGADFYVKNKNHKYPIHYIIDSQCIMNLKAVESLLQVKQCDNEVSNKASPYVNVKDHRDQNCLHLLAESLAYENNDKIIELMCTLISYGCNMNSPNDDQETPFYIVARKLPHLKDAQEIFDKLTKSTQIDYYTHKGDEIVTMVKDKFLTELPEKENFVVCYEEMVKLLESGDINKFETKFCFYKPEEDNETFRNSCYSYLEIAVQKSYINIVDLLIKKGIDFNQTSLENKEDKIPPPFLAYKNANVEIFKSFLLANAPQKINLNWDNGKCQVTLLHQFFSDMKRKFITPKCQTIKMSRNQIKCFKLLINDPRCDQAYLNVLDEHNKPVIYYSVKYGVDYITIKLLQKGAYIGPVITKIRKSLLSDLLDRSITSNGEFHDSKEFEMTVNYKFLMPVEELSDNSEIIKNAKASNGDISLNTLGRDSKNGSKHDIEEDMPNKSSLFMDEIKYSSEMYALKLLADNYDYRHFIMHPVLSSFIFLKWKKIRFSLHIDLFTTLLFILTFIPYIMISRSTQEGLGYKICFGLAFTSLFILMLREILQFSLSKRRYFLIFSNWVDIILIVASIFVLFRLPFGDHKLRTLHTIVILLATCDCFYRLGYLPFLSVSLHAKIFRRVLATFLKSLAFFSIMIFGLALASYTLYGDEISTLFSNASITINFRNIQSAKAPDYLSLRIGPPEPETKINTAEFGISNFYLDDYNYIGFFALFLTIVIIILCNLLNALTVSAAQEIKSDAKLIDLRERISVMCRKEKLFSGNSRVNFFLQNIVSLFSSTVEDGIICLKPNITHDTLTIEGEAIKNDWFQNILCYFDRHMTMDAEIIQNMHTLLVNKHEEQINKR